MRIILIGFGTVGQAVARILLADTDRIVKSHGFKPQITTIVDSQGSCTDEEGVNLRLALETKKKYGTIARYPGNGETSREAFRLVSESEGEVVVETTQMNLTDGEPALTILKTALAARKHVVTSNKGPLAFAMPALLELAHHQNVMLRFSGTVGAGTPFLDFAGKCLLGEPILQIHGILNGTTNYVLTRMQEASISFSKALHEASEKGYAEADPTTDITGMDTAAKLVILANWLLNRRVRLRDIDTEGIDGISQKRLRAAGEKGKRIKLIGRIDQSVASVRPEEVSTDDPICVPGPLNALTFTTKHAGQITLVGPGAGGIETASSIIRDLVEIRLGYVG